MRFFGKATLPIIYFSTTVTICSLYAAQPIQPVFQQEFGLNRTQALLFTTLMMAPLGGAPLIYGYLLEATSARTLVRRAVFALGGLEMLFCMAGSYWSLLSIRAIQGLMIPAILTSLMSYISYTSRREDVQHAIAVYIAATILGGFLGRFLSGIMTDFFGWRFFFFMLGLLLLVSSFLLGCLEKNVKSTYERPDLNQMNALLRQGRYPWLCMIIFCLFFVFSALMNILPFELKHINHAFREAGVGFLYLGYSMGILASMNTRRILRCFGNESHAIMAGILIFLLGTATFFTARYAIMFMGMFVFCFGFFMTHSLLSGFVNKLVNENKALANGGYISCYYLGGTLGTFMPGYVFGHFGWDCFLAVLVAVVVVAFLFTARMQSVVGSSLDP